MKKLSLILTILFICNGVPVSLFAAGDSAQILKTVKIVFKAVQKKKYDLASRQLDYEGMGETVMRHHWKKMSQSDKAEMIKGIEVLNRKNSFPNGTDMFKHLSTILYGKPRIKKNTGWCKTTVVVYQNYKKKEIVIDFKLNKRKDKWRVVDIYMIGEGVIDGIYEDDVKVLIKEGGIPAVMKALRETVAEANKK